MSTQDWWIAGYAVWSLVAMACIVGLLIAVARLNRVIADQYDTIRAQGNTINSLARSRQSPARGDRRPPGDR